MVNTNPPATFQQYDTCRNNLPQDNPHYGFPTDAKIRKAFKEAIPGTTKIIIAQRVSSVEDADRIIVMDNGKINGIGSHEELSSLLSLALTGKQLQVLLAKNEDLLKTTFISYEKRPRTNKARMICLRYHGNEEI